MCIESTVSPCAPYNIMPHSASQTFPRERFPSLFETQFNISLIMSAEEKSISVLKRMLSGRELVCPGCWHAYTNFIDLKKHLGQKKDTAHQDLLHLAESCHRKRDQIDNFGRDAFAEKKAPGDTNVLKARLEIYLEIAIASGMNFVCPQCVTESFQYFNLISDFHDHCRKKGDPMHLSFLPHKNERFISFYLTAMGRAGIDKAPFGSDNPGRQTTTPYMRVKYVMQEKNFAAGPTWPAWVVCRSANRAGHDFRCKEFQNYILGFDSFLREQQ